MQEIVVQSTKYPEIVVQGSRYDYTSDIVLVVVGILAAAAIIWRYTATRRGKDLTSFASCAWNRGLPPIPRAASP
jgi:hypothetical protein